jgi:recombination associated protein RdgC
MPALAGTADPDQSRIPLHPGSQMFFRNLTLFRFPTSIDFSEIDKLLPEALLRPVGPLEMTSRGFISPFGRDEQEVLSHRIGDFLWLTVGGEDKILPGSVVNDLLARKVAEIEEKEGRRPGGRARKRLKDDLIHELLPRAFVKTSRTDAMLDLQHGYVAVDTSSRKTGENVMSEIRGLLGSFPALPLNAEVAPRSVLTGWIAGEPLPEGLSLGEECEMKDPIEGGAVVKCQHQELRCEEIDKHLEAGKQVTKLALVLDDHVSFVLGDDLVIRKLKFLDGALDQLEHSEEDGARAELDARFALMSGEVRRLFLLLEQALKFSAAEG